MAGPVQKAMSGVVSIASGAVIAGKKLKEDEKQISEKQLAKEQAEKENQKNIQSEAEKVALASDLIVLGADPESAKAFVNARELGLDTKPFGMIRRKGKFIGSYSSLADKLSRDSLTDSLSSKVINEKGFSNRVVALGGNRRGRIDALVKASQGGKNNGKE